MDGQTEGLTDRHMMKLIVAFSDFANVPQNLYDVLSGYY